MVFRNFRLMVILRVIVLAIGALLLAWCIVNDHLLRAVYVAAGMVILVIEFIYYVDRFNNDVNTLMRSLLQRDFTTRYQATGKGKSFDALYDVLNRISDSFRTISKEREVQYRYLELLIEHVQVSILSIDREGKIHLANQAAKTLLKKFTLSHVHQLETFGPVLVETIDQLKSGETRLVNIRIGDDALQLSIHVSEIKLEEKYYKLISMQNIRSELDAREMEAWQKLIRVLSHEIMNSVAPVISLSATLHGVVTQNEGSLRRQDPAVFESLNQGLEAIKVRSEGLFNFTQSYRKLTGVPKVVRKETDLTALIGRVRLLLQARLDEHGIALVVPSAPVTLHVDPELMEHVLINLLLNAVEAVIHRPAPRIVLKTSLHQKGNTSLHIEDNGEGIDEDVADKIFIPFFTTRKTGSGIGLALTKQILQLHQADIQFTSRKGVGTEFIITFGLPAASGT